MTSPIRSVRLALLVVLACGAFDASAATSFPHPAELEADVAFWVAIFTEYDSDKGVLHDSRNLAVIYEPVDIPATMPRKSRHRAVDARRRHYRKILQSLAAGRRANLTSEEQAVLDLWPKNVANDELARAANDIRYQQGLSDRFRAGLQRAGRYRAFIHDEFTSLGIPVELAALPHVESSYNPDARSHVGASGIWQFTRGTGRRFMQVDHVVDERNDPFAASIAAGRLLAYNYSITGNWPMAITAYNHGLSGVRRAMRSHSDFVEILRQYRGRAFGFASRNFYVAFLAALEVDRNAERYFPGLVTDSPVDYEVLALDSYVSADSLAGTLGLSKTELARHNPALQAAVWEGSKYLPRKYQLRLPRGTLQAPLGQLVASVPENEFFTEQLPDVMHRIVRGDTLSQIAQYYGTTVSTLVALNNLGSGHRIRAGTELRLPAAGPAPIAVLASAEPSAEIAPESTEPAAANEDLAAMPAGEDLSSAAAMVRAAEAEPLANVEEPEPAGGALADDLGASAEAELQSTLLTDPSDYTVAGDRTIEVHPLETLGHFADWLGIRTQRLRDINGLAFRTPVTVGQRIRLDLSSVDAKTFESRRAAWHKDQQDAFFRNYRISGLREHQVKNGESVWVLALQKYQVPVWLFRQYNPELDLHRVQQGSRLSFPILVSNES